MTEAEKMQFAMNVIADQRNAALNDIVNLRIQLAEMQQEIEQMKTKEAT